MTLTRWKMMAGVLGISIVGVVAMASPQCPNTKKDQGREPAPPVTVASAVQPLTLPTVGGKSPTWNDHEKPLMCGVGLHPPSECTEKSKATSTPVLPLVEAPPALPSVVAVPKLDVPQLSLPGGTIPELPTLSSNPPAVELPKVTPAPVAKAEPTVLSELPSIKGIDLPTTVPQVATPKVELPKAEPMPPKPDRVVELPLPGVQTVKSAAPVPELPLVAETKPLPGNLPSAPSPRILLDEPPVASPTTLVKKPDPTPEKPARPSAEESAVRIVIHLGTGQPKFDVMSGEDVLLKAVCNNMDIRSPNENGAGVTPLKAGGKVQFSAPGCEGTCDNLTVLPTTGEVELAGNVKVHCRMGKGETEINATTMKFKLGSAPAYTVPEPTVKPVSAREASRP